MKTARIFSLALLISLLSVTGLTFTMQNQEIKKEEVKQPEAKKEEVKQPEAKKEEVKQPEAKKEEVKKEEDTSILRYFKSKWFYLPATAVAALGGAYAGEHYFGAVTKALEVIAENQTTSMIAGGSVATILGYLALAKYLQWRPFRPAVAEVKKEEKKDVKEEKKDVKEEKKDVKEEVKK